MLNIQSLITFPIPNPHGVNKEIEQLIDSQMHSPSYETQSTLNRVIYSMYSFTEEELAEIEQV